MAIDAVITWVDGSDVTHLKKRQSYFKSLGLTISDASIAERLHSSRELEFCLMALFKYMPWLRKIYIVTDNQTPEILEKIKDSACRSQIEVVDHRVIFEGFEDCLPTFNSLAIESLLWRIPGISEQFIYFNDDCIVLRSLTPEDFFKGNQIKLRGRWKLQSPYEVWSYKKVPPHRRFQETSAKLAGFKYRFIHLPHTPFPLSKVILEQFFTKHPKLLKENIQHALRAPDQFWSVALHYHLGMQSKQVIRDNQYNAMSVHATHHPLRKIKAKLKKVESNPNTAFLCVQNLSQGPKAVQTHIIDWLTAWMVS